MKKNERMEEWKINGRLERLIEWKNERMEE